MHPFWYFVGLAVLICWIFSMAKEQKNLLEKESTLRKTAEFQIENKRKLNQREDALNEREIAIKTMAQEKSKGFPWLANAYADYVEFQDAKIADYLENKPHPAKSAALNVLELSKQKRELAQRNKVLEYTLKYYESLFPWLQDFREIEDDALINTDSLSSDEEDSAKRWLAPGEYEKLGTIEKYQLALDRFTTRKKTQWEIGRDYERYIGYIYEQKGYSVEYKGIIDGFEDLGRDLVCRGKEDILIIQCKYWSVNKVIHEKHINQLFGTTVMYFLKQNSQFSHTEFATSLQNRTLVPLLYTHTVLSETAKEFATALGVIFHEKVEIGNYPLIKCNINRANGAKIYHLPFDQQYDKTKIAHQGECYVSTVSEAERLGFRRAMRWFAETPTTK